MSKKYLTDHQFGIYAYTSFGILSQILVTSNLNYCDFKQIKLKNSHTAKMTPGGNQAPIYQ